MPVLALSTMFAVRQVEEGARRRFICKQRRQIALVVHTSYARFERGYFYVFDNIPVSCNDQSIYKFSMTYNVWIH